MSRCAFSSGVRRDSRNSARRSSSAMAVSPPMVRDRLSSGRGANEDASEVALIAESCLIGRTESGRPRGGERRGPLESGMRDARFSLRSASPRRSSSSELLLSLAPSSVTMGATPSSATGVRFKERSASSSPLSSSGSSRASGWPSSVRRRARLRPASRWSVGESARR